METIKLRNYLGLVRFSHTLFALPFALASVLLAADGLPTLKVFLLILAAMVTARNSAMGFNRYVDASIDAKNPRTQDRHLPKKILSKQEVHVFIGLNGLLFFVICYFINSLAFYLAPLTLGILFFYSFAKRWTAASHFILGLCLAISPVGAWIAVRGVIEWPPLLLGLALFLWVSGFDMIYSTLDADFDRRVGLFSFPAKFGISQTLKIALGLHLGMIGILILFGALMELGPFYRWGVAAIAAVVIWEHMQAGKRDVVSINKAFFGANALVSLLFLGVIALDKL